MDMKYVIFGFVLGAALGYWRMKSSPTVSTPRAKGF